MLLWWFCQTERTWAFNLYFWQLPSVRPDIGKHWLTIQLAFNVAFYVPTADISGEFSPSQGSVPHSHYGTCRSSCINVLSLSSCKLLPVKHTNSSWWTVMPSVHSLCIQNKRYSRLHSTLSSISIHLGARMDVCWVSLSLKQCRLGVLIMVYLIAIFSCWEH